MNRLFEGSSIGEVQIRNKFIRSGTWMSKATEDGQLTSELFDEYEKLAKGSLGMVIAGYSRVNAKERANNQMIGMYDDKFIPDLQKFTSMFHAHDTKVGIQLAMGGTQVHYDGEVDWDIVSPSPAVVVRTLADGSEMEIAAAEMTVEQIKFVIADFVNAARRVKAANFDLVQLHAGHGYFISQWMNPKLNRRSDEYGQDPAKFIIELYQAVRAEVGDEFPIGIKINSEEQVGDDSNHERMLDLCKRLDELGIDLIEVSGCAPSRTKISLDKEGYFAEFASKLTKQVDCKVMLTGGNKTFNNFEQLMDESGIDFIGLSRPLVSEPDLVARWQANNDYKSRCISCNHCHRKTYTCVFDK